MELGPSLEEDRCPARLLFGLQPCPVMNAADALTT
jgi:hypothetical protein